MLQKNTCTCFFAGLLAFSGLLGSVSGSLCLRYVLRIHNFAFRFCFHFVKARVAVTKRMNFRKSSKGRGVIFNPKIYIADFGHLYWDFCEEIAIQVVLRRLVLEVGVRVSCFIFTLVWVNTSSRSLWGGAVGAAGFCSKLVEEAGG